MVIVPLNYYNEVKWVTMNVDNLVLVEYNSPEIDAIERRPGWLREGSQHFLIIQEIVGAELYSYTIIPRGLIVKITKLRVLEK